MSVSVADFYAGKSVLITGGTGCLGKVILEKLLYSCPQVDKLYVLIREKENLTVQQRLETLLNIPIFDRLRNVDPQQLTKIIPVAGDIVFPNLGIRPEDEQILIKKVSVVIHSAATVKSNEKLKTALNVNYEGTKKVLDLCRRMDKLKVFLHVSTAFSKISDGVVEEKLCPVPVDINKLYDDLKECPESAAYKFMCGYPNTYTFTKALAESLVLANSDVATVVVKPSIVTPSNLEPVEGWVDNWNGATRLLSGIGKGYCRTILSRKQNILDVIPVDYVSNLIIVAAAQCHHTSTDVQVFNCCSSSVNPITVGQMTDLFTKETVKNGCNDVPFPKAIMTQWRCLYWMFILFLEIIPACIADFCFIQFAVPPKFIKLQAQAFKVRHSTEYYTNKSWQIENGKARALAASLSPLDAKLFPCDPSDISWPEYITVYFNGVKRFLIDNKLKA